MDKLEPLIKHRFWILLGVCLPLIMFGYMSASGKIQDATKTREDDLDGVYNGVPGGELPNQTWADGLGEINEDYDLEVALAHFAILEKQSDGMDWPANLSEYVPEEYRGEFLGDAGFIYVDEYENLLQGAYQIAEPIVRDGNGYTGKVSLAYAVLPRHEFRDDELFVSSERMWDAQEDIWFLRQLLQAVRTMNSSADNIAKSPVRMITRLDFMGGDGQFGAPAASAMSGGDDESMYEMEMMQFDEVELDDLGGTAGMPAAGSRVDFDPADEFGNSIAVRTATAEGAETTLGTRTGSTRQEIRYVALNESLPFRERGFYMSVLIDQRRIAEFLVTLSNSEWPVRIVRFHVGPNPHGAAASARDSFESGDYGSPYEREMNALDFDESAFDYSGGAPGSSGYGPRQNVVNDGALAGAFSHPDLVQLEVLGAITFFNPLPDEVLAKVAEALEAVSAAPVERNTQPAEPATGNEPPVEPGAGGSPDASLPAPDESLIQPDADAELGAEGSDDETPTP